MFKISESNINDFKSLFENHRLHISACNIYFHTIRMINGHHKILDRETYKEYYHNILKDIELVTAPIDAFIPADDTVNDIFVINQLVPEYERIAKRVTLDDLYENIPVTHEVYMKLKENPNLLSTVVDDAFIYFCVYKYLDQIDNIRLRTYSNMTPIIEYVVKNITLNDIKSFLISRRINEDKYEKYCKDVLFNPDVAHTQTFYSTPHGDIQSFDTINLMMRLASNIVIRSDIYIIIGIYLVMSFAISDIVNEKVDDSPCVQYVRDVISKI